MYCSQCGKEIPNNSKFCYECGNPISQNTCGGIANDQSIENKDPSFSISDYEPKFDLENYEKQQNAYGRQQETIQEIEQMLVSDRKIILILLLITLGLFCIGFQFAYNQHHFWACLFILAGIGAIWLLAIGAETQSKNKKRLRLAKTNYQEYIKAEEEKERLRQEAWQKNAQASLEREIERKEIERRKAECHKKGIPCCAKCGSSSIATINRGYSMVTGFIGSGKPVNVCQKCGYKWQIGK